jgi:hypothetical protein
MRVLELYSGTGSVGRVAREMGHEVVSLDISDKYNPTYVCDVLQFDYTSIWTPGEFYLVHASPPCDSYSCISNHMFNKEERDKRATEANAVTRRTLEIIQYLQPKYYIVENPATSLIWKQGIFDQLPGVMFKKVSYCMYSDWGYRKNTTLATNIDFVPKICTGQCGYVRQIKDAQGKIRFLHESVAKQGVSQHTRGLGVQQSTHKRWELWRIPEQLVKDILNAV